MKYLKPDVEVIDFTSEEITADPDIQSDPNGANPNVPD